MKRGDIFTASGDKDYTGKPRPALIVQDDRFEATDSITICAFTTDDSDAPLLRLPILPSARNGLHAPCRLMVDKISTIPKTKLGSPIGKLDDEDMQRLNQSLLIFLGLAVSPKARGQGGQSVLMEPKKSKQALLF